MYVNFARIDIEIYLNNGPRIWNLFKFWTLRSENKIRRTWLVHHKNTQRCAPIPLKNSWWQIGPLKWHGLEKKVISIWKQSVSWSRNRGSFEIFHFKISRKFEKIATSEWKAPFSVEGQLVFVSKFMKNGAGHRIVRTFHNWLFFFCFSRHFTSGKYQRLVKWGKTLTGPPFRDDKTKFSGDNQFVS